MREKDDKLRLVKQILVDDNGIVTVPSASKDCTTATPSCTEATTKATDVRSRRVSTLIDDTNCKHIVHINVLHRIKPLLRIQDTGVHKVQIGGLITDQEHSFL